jgi:VWFA-related protein
MLLRNSPAVLILAASFATCAAQTPVPSQNQAGDTSQTTNPQGANQGYTFRAESRVVLTDVTVTDAKGNPIHGLPQSAFHIFDNKKPQVISTFEEHTHMPVAAVVPAAAHGDYSNDFLLHLPPVLNVLVIDIVNLNITDQMYLYYELTRFIKQMPEGQSLAVYLRPGTNTVLLQNFTPDRNLLLAAVHKAIPRFPPHGREYLSDLDTLRQISLSLSQYSGRKNLIWFSGGSTLFLRPDASSFQDAAAMRAVYDELEQERIAVYPIDARGLTTSEGPSQLGQWQQHMLMNDVATATGGHAFYNTNGLLEAAGQVLDSSGSFYTLTYSPHDFRFNNKWHNVRVAVEGDAYRLSYRSGYFADGAVSGAEPTRKTRTHILIGGDRLEEDPDLRSQPIIFQARGLPSSDPAIAALPKATAVLPPPEAKKGTVPFSIRYTLPVDAFTQRITDSKTQIVLGVGAFAFNRDGNTVARDAVRITMTLNAESLRLHPDAPFLVDQQLNLVKGDETLYLSVWDMTNGRLGTLQIPLEVPKPSKVKDETAKN